VGEERRTARLWRRRVQGRRRKGRRTGQKRTPFIWFGLPDFEHQLDRLLLDDLLIGADLVFAAAVEVVLLVAVNAVEVATRREARPLLFIFDSVMIEEETSDRM
jgi:hypothetical protein